MAEELYGDAETVITLSGIRASDLALDDDDALTAFIEARLTEIKVLIDRDRNRSDFEDQGWLDAINGIANRWCVEGIRLAMATRDSPIVRVDDFKIALLSDQVPSRSILSDLHKFPKAADTAATRKRYVFCLSRVDCSDNNDEEEYDPDNW